MREKDFFRGQVSVYAECVVRGCKRIAQTSLVDTLGLVKGKFAGTIETSLGEREVMKIPSPTKEMASQFFKIARDIARNYRVKVQCRKIATVFGTYKAADYHFIFYKDHNDLWEYWQLRKNLDKRKISRNEYDRRMGKLFGYGEKEIKEFIAKSAQLEKEGRIFSNSYPQILDK